MKQLLFKPFEKFSALQLIVAGLIFTAMGTFFAIQFNGRFDGVLDFHFVASCVKGQAIIDNAINVACLFIFLFIAGKLINPKTRVIDSLSTAIFARLPLYLLPLLNFNGNLGLNTDPTDLSALQDYVMNNFIFIIITAIITITFIVWYVALLYNGYKTASNAKGSKAIWLFVAALLLAEIASKILIYQLN